MELRTDIDGTLIVPRDGRKFPKNESDWTWLNPRVVPKLRQLHQDGYVRVAVSTADQDGEEEGN